MKTVLLLNAEYVQSICLGRSFQKQGWRVVCFCNHKCTSGYVSRFLDERYKVPDVKTKYEDFDKYIKDYLTSHKVSLIIPMIDDSAEYLSKNKEYLEETYHLICAVAPQSKFDYARDKQKLMLVCDENNISHPLTCPLTLPLEEEGYLRRFPYPAMIKPNLSAGARGITKVENFEMLCDKFPAIREEFGDCTLQQFVEQPDHYYNVMMYRGKGGDILASAVIKIRRYFPLKGGTACYSETCELPELVEQCGKLLDILDWEGFADFDVLEDVHTGELKIIEINPRVPSSLQGGFAAGIDFGKVFVSDLFGGELPSFDYKNVQQVRWFGLDVMWFLFSPNRFKFKPSWFRFFGKNVSYHDGSWNNPMPMIAGCLAGVLKYLDPEVRKAKLGK